MPELSVKRLICTEAITVSDVVCAGTCRHRTPEECAGATTLVFPYRGVFARHVGATDAVGEANQVLFFNRSEGYQISHPVVGGDCCLSVRLRDDLLAEMIPAEMAVDPYEPRFNGQSRGIDARAQVLVALLRHGLDAGLVDDLEAETLTLTLLRRALGERTGRSRLGSLGRKKVVDRAKLVMSSDLSRRWTLSDIAGEVGVSPVYLTQLFQQVEGMPLYRYHIRLRLARALDLLPKYDDLTHLALDLGFSSHSHFTAAFRKTFGRTPADFQRALHKR